MNTKTIKEIFSKDIINTYINQLWRLVSGPVSLFLIPLFITPEIQGFWYTFGSISALSVFADLGFTTIILQFSAHEYAHLKFNEKLEIEGSEEYKKRLASLFRFVMKWAGGLIAIAFPVIFLVGYILFMQKASTSVWLLPWILYSIGSAIGFFSSVLASFVQGCDQVSTIQKLGFYSAVINTSILFSSLLLHFGLFAISLTLFVTNICYLALMLLKYKKFIKSLFATVPDHTNWKADIFKLLWKYALSWSSGYFIFQIYTPFMFQFHGPLEAGKVGISISLATVVFGISNTWLSANNPKINMLVAKKDWPRLDREFKKDLILALGTYCLEIMTIIFALLIFSGRWAFFDKIKIRFLSIIPLSMLISGWFMQIIVNGMAMYLRAHKQEPYVVPSVVSGIFIILVTFLCAKYLKPNMFFLGFLGSYIYGLPWTYKIFAYKKREWHII